MQTNQKPDVIHTHEGGKAKVINPWDQLKRSVLSCLLFESEFYEDGKSISERIETLVPLCSLLGVLELAVQARGMYFLRHVPLLLLRTALKHPDFRKLDNKIYVDAVYKTIRRPDELCELLALYWKDGKYPLPSALKRGLAKAFQKFDAYQLAKYNRPKKIWLRDVMRMVHPLPKDAKQAETWKRLVQNRLSPADTWEMRLSRGDDKKETFTKLLEGSKLGYMALLRNLRNMSEAGVDEQLIFNALERGAYSNQLLPFRFIAAMNAVPKWEPQIELAMVASLQKIEKLPGKTILLVDVSGSMSWHMSSKSDLNRSDAAQALGILLAGVCESFRCFTFSHDVVEVPPRQGKAFAEAIENSQEHGGTYLGKAVLAMNKLDHDRLIVISDEQACDRVGDPVKKGYMINVASAQNGVGYGPWVHIDGMSEAVVNFITAHEKDLAFVS